MSALLAASALQLLVLLLPSWMRLPPDGMAIMDPNSRGFRVPSSVL